MIAVQTSPDFANMVLNHPAVLPDASPDGKPMDVSAAIGDPNHLVLGGEHGVFFVTKLLEGSWEVHTAVLPEGRGAWARDFAEGGARHMFVATDCVEILTRVPHGHDGAARLAHNMGFRHQFTTPPETLFRGKKVKCAVSVLTIQDWALRVPGSEEGGARFHEWMNSKIPGRPHAPDPDHNRVVGLCLDMIQAGQTMKGIIWYNRWAFTARHPLIRLVGIDPVQVRFDAGLLTMKDGKIGLELCH